MRAARNVMVKAVLAPVWSLAELLPGTALIPALTTGVFQVFPHCFLQLLPDPIQEKNMLQHWLYSDYAAKLLNILPCLAQKTMSTVFQEISYLLEHRELHVT